MWQSLPVYKRVGLLLEERKLLSQIMRIESIVGSIAQELLIKFMLSGKIRGYINYLFTVSYLLISTRVILQDNYLTYNQLAQALSIIIHVINKRNAILSNLTYMILHMYMVMSTYRKKYTVNFKRNI